MMEDTAVQASDDTAPGLVPDAQHLPWWQRALAQGAGYFLPSLAFLIMPAAFALDEAPARILVIIAVSVVVGVFFIGTTVVMDWSKGARWSWLGCLSGSVALLGVVTDLSTNPAYFTAYVTACAAVLIRWEHARAVIPAVSLLSLGGSVWLGDLFGAIMAMVGLTIGLTTGLGLEAERTRSRLRVAEERTATLAVAAERARIGRDLHDILGHSLTTIAIKGDLAARLVGRDDTRALVEVAELTAVARQALADVRATASGLKEVRLASEIASARSVLTAAGVEASTSPALPALSDHDSEVLGYVVREAITNVVRHAGATTCTITVRGTSVSVADDGRGFGGSRPGNGLQGLERRLQEAGGSLHLDSSGEGATITARLGGAT